MNDVKEVVNALNNDTKNFFISLFDSNIQNF